MNTATSKIIVICQQKNTKYAVKCLDFVKGHSYNIKGDIFVDIAFYVSKCVLEKGFSAVARYNANKSVDTLTRVTLCSMFASGSQPDIAFMQPGWGKSRLMGADKNCLLGYPQRRRYLK